MAKLSNPCCVEKLLYEGEYDSQLDLLERFLHLEEENNLEEISENYTDESEAETIPYHNAEDQNLDDYEDLLEDDEINAS